MANKKGSTLQDQTEASFRHFDEMSSKRFYQQTGGKKSGMLPVLRVIKGPLIGEHFILSKAKNLVGRDSECDLGFNDPKLSREHCQITVQKVGQSQKKFSVTIEDLGSRNGVLVNNQKIDEPCPLQAGDQIKIGSNVYGYYIKFPEEIELESYLYKIATRDATTGLVNKTFFENNLDFELKRALRYKRPLSFVLMDLDHFKMINDKYGHNIGDIVLKKVGEIILSELRFEDTAIRYGGEEFALLLPETSEADALSLISRIQKKMGRATFKVHDRIFQVTASFGVSHVQDGVTTTQLLFELADKALYRAKDLGRNRIERASHKLAS